MTQAKLFFANQTILKKAVYFTALFLLLAAAAAMPVSAQKGGSGGGGIPGDTFLYYIIYPPEQCPLPPSIIGDYVSIAFCGLGKRSNNPSDFVLNVDGYTLLAPGTVKNVRETSTIVLPCGNVAFVNRFTESAFAQTSPPPPPYRLFTSSVKFPDTCR